MSYIVMSGHTVPSKIKGQLPDIVYQYISDDSTVPYHYTLTRDKKTAYVFDESEIEMAKEIAFLLNMKMVSIED